MTLRDTLPYPTRVSRKPSGCTSEPSGSRDYARNYVGTSKAPLHPGVGDGGEGRGGADTEGPEEPGWSWKSG